MENAEKEDTSEQMDTEKRNRLISIFMITGIILVMESIIFIYSTLRGFFNHIPIWVFYFTLIIGIADLTITFRYQKNHPYDIHERGENSNMAPYLKKIDRYIPIHRRYVALSLGMFFVIFAYTHYLIGIGTSKIGDGDLILIMFGAFLAIYPSVHEEYSMERDFILTFLGLLAIFMTVLPLLFDVVGGSFIYYFLTSPVHSILSMIGIKNELVPPNRIIFWYGSELNIVIIARSCSGIYSFSIFSSSFIAFVLVVYRRIDIRSTLFMILGISLAYIGNVIRMTIVIAAGHYYGNETMKWVHETLGYIIFFLWMGIFWILLYHFLMKKRTGE